MTLFLVYPYPLKQANWFSFLEREMYAVPELLALQYQQSHCNILQMGIRLRR